MLVVRFPPWRRAFPHVKRCITPLLAPNFMFSTRNMSSKRDRMGNRKKGNHERPPPHLKGKQIGMFFAQRNKERNEQNKKRPLGTILLSESRKNQIQAVLNSTSLRNLFVTTSGTYEHVEDSVFKRNFLRVINETIDEKLLQTSEVIAEDATLNLSLYEEFLKKQSNPKYVDMKKKRKKLPAFSMKEEILKVIDENQVVVISGETGCGKTTQVAQFILDDFLQKKRGSVCKILCTQPRRISAITVAQRVAEERAESLGNSVGYHIRMESRLPRDRGSIYFCTTGVVLKMMESDASLSWVSHLILDEIHERDVMSDFILALIKKIKVKRSDLKIILMSATLNSEKFSKYYDNAPHLNIPGFTYPVQEFYLEDVLQRTGFVFPPTGRIKQKKLKEYSDFIEPHVRQLERTNQYSRQVCIQLRKPESEDLNLDLIVQLVVDICQKEQDKGAILIFLTGFQEISTLTRLISENGHFPSSRFLIFPLHSLMPTVDQKQIFETPPRGMRKIIIATNIAETSITIDDVVYVIDCGKIKVTNFDVRTNSDILSPEWVSLANANQRRGRAGRVRPGMCFHLFSKARNMLLEQYQLPEILRTRLEDVILTAKVLQLGKVEQFFAQLIDSPDPEAVSVALELLKRMNALTDDEKLTPLGYHLAKLPMSPQMGKMILFGAIFSCLDPILSIAAALDFKDPFQLPIGKEKEVNNVKLELSRGIKSDHLLFHEALKGFEESGSSSRQFCWNYFLSHQTLKQLQDMKKQYMEYLYEMNFVPNSNPKCPECNLNSNNLSLIKAIICAGLYPNIAISTVLGKPPVKTPDMKRLKLHPKSILSSCKYFDTNILVYYRKMKSKSDFIHDASLIHPLPVIFFGDKFNQICEDGRIMISINQNLRFKCTESTASIIKDLRDRFNWFLEYKISHPGPVIWGGDDETKILNVIMELITCEDMEEYDDDAFDDD
ncbi:ATP-dependent DNA/RNA helicase DHX36 [Tribolium madens]|uniref:ATP-dependent DNA/RNA helicase DHX36 n=1 Tax=Tribolium madens TaxID=41895 RepID=UPI001CF73541|nr:ATP-dependent DNA/RNA helicase DHX36 [Tribolium madens]